VGHSRMRHDTRTPEEVVRNVRQLELRRHARRDPDVDRLSPAGRAQAEDVGRTATTAYDVVFVSPSHRAAETAAWFLRGAGQQLPDHEVVPGLGGRDASGGSPVGMASGVRALLDRVPDGGRGLAISHTPLVEHAALGLTGDEIDPLRECEGILVTLKDDGSIDIEELRLDGGSHAG
jgi:phosphohistidine phosphatase SixA